MFRLITLSILCFLLALPLSTEEVQAPIVSAKEGYYTIIYNNRSVNLELSVNGFVVKDGSSNEDSSGQMDLNYWIMPGKNTISFRLTERKLSKKSENLIKPEVKLLLVIGQKGQFPDEGEQLVTYAWPKEKEKNAIPSKEWIHLEFAPPFIPPTKLWLIAQKIDLTPDIEAKALAYVESFVAALISKDSNKILAFTSFRARDTSEARYYHYNPEKEKKSLNGMLKAVGRTWKLNRKIKFNFLCNQTIVHLTDKKSNPILTGKSDSTLPLYLSLVDGKWMIVR